MATRNGLILAGLVLGAAACGGGDKPKDSGTTQPAAVDAARPSATPPPAAAAGGTEPFLELFSGVKLVRLPASEGGDAYQVVLPPQANEDPIPNGPVEVRVTSGGTEVTKGVPRALYRCPKSIRSMRFKLPDAAQGLSVAMFVADPKAVAPQPKPPAAAKAPPKAGDKGKPKVVPQTPEQVGLDMANAGAAKGLAVGAPIPGLSKVLTAADLARLKIPGAGERMVKESCG